MNTHNIPPRISPGDIEYEVASRSPSSEKIRGTYANHVTREAVEAIVRGPLGGYFESFGGGRFVYVAFTE